MSTNNKHIPEWLDPIGVHRVYGFSRGRQGFLRKKRGMPHSRVGRYIRYDRFEVDKWLNLYKVA
jgi:hypothetical protein